jgi:hypothetical protein
MSKILIIESSLNDINKFIEGINNETQFYVYGEQNLPQITSNISHIGFVYHYLGYQRFPFFPDSEEYDETGQLVVKLEIFSNRFKDWVQQIKEINPNIIIDLLTCNVFDINFQNTIKQFEEDYGITFRYSTNEKGSLKGADWIQESHNIDVKSLYFSEEINNWTHTLTTGLLITDSRISDYFKQVGNIFYLKSNLNWGPSIGRNVSDFIILTANQILDGNGNEIIIDNQNTNLTIETTIYRGIISTNDSSVTSFTNSPIIRNLKVSWIGMSTTESGGTLGFYGGIIRREQQFFRVNNCLASSKTTGGGRSGIGGQCGGICGFACGLNNGRFLIEHSIYDGNIGFSSSNQGSGGIIGSQCQGGFTNSATIVRFCSVIGNILASFGGGITGSAIGRNSSTILIDRCLTSGSISLSGGGIGGSEFGRGAVSCIIQNCYSFPTNTFSGTSGMGGIVGPNSSRKVTAEEDRGNCQIVNCYSTAVIGGSTSSITGNHNLSSGDYGTIAITRCVGNNPLFRGNATITQTSNSTDLNTINNKLYSNWPTANWIATPTYPQLVIFQSSPWSGYSTFNTIPTLNFTTINFEPDPPTNIVATQESNTISVSFLPPIFNGGSIITNYTVNSNIGNITANGKSSPIVLIGFNDSFTYTFTVFATNSIGNSINSIASNQITYIEPIVPTIPYPPTITSITTSKGLEIGTATISFNPPANNGNSPIISYTVTSNPENIITTGSSSPIIVSGLTNGINYTFTISATNSIGTSLESSPSNSVFSEGKPLPPTIINITVLNQSVLVAFEANNNGGSEILQYEIVAIPNNSLFEESISVGFFSPIYINELINGEEYRFKISASNIYGKSEYSELSNIFIPSIPNLSINQTIQTLNTFLQSLNNTENYSKIVAKNNLNRFLNQQKTNRFNLTTSNNINRISTNSFYNSSLQISTILVLLDETVTTESEEQLILDLTTEINQNKIIYFPVIGGETIKLSYNNEIYTFKVNSENNQITNITINNSIIINSVGETFSNFRCVFFGGFGFQFFNNVAGAGSDPYITTLYNYTFELPHFERWWNLFSDISNNFTILAHTKNYKGGNYFDKIFIFNNKEKIIIDYLNKNISSFSKSENTTIGKTFKKIKYKKGNKIIEEEKEFDCIQIYHPIYEEVVFIINWRNDYFHPFFKNFPINATGLLMTKKPSFKIKI